ncbi:MAG: hypothetical protein P9M14_00260 [Candidatus Alcyoniella australis]|nr:hypothetical protein [Candidatus Alcyoniella australis]
MRSAAEMFEEFRRRATESFGAQAKGGQATITDLIKHPSPPFDKAPPVLRTLVTVAGLVSVATLAGMGFVALALLVLCTLLLLLILHHVLGIELTLDPNEMFF